MNPGGSISGRNPRAAIPDSQEKEIRSPAKQSPETKVSAVARRPRHLAKAMRTTNKLINRPVLQPLVESAGIVVEGIERQLDDMADGIGQTILGSKNDVKVRLVNAIHLAVGGRNSLRDDLPEIEAYASQFRALNYDHLQRRLAGALLRMMVQNLGAESTFCDGKVGQTALKEGPARLAEWCRQVIAEDIESRLDDVASRIGCEIRDLNKKGSPSYVGAIYKIVGGKTGQFGELSGIRACPWKLEGPQCDQARLRLAGALLTHMSANLDLPSFDWPGAQAALELGLPNLRNWCERQLRITPELPGTPSPHRPPTRSKSDFTLARRNPQRSPTRGQLAEQRGRKSQASLDEVGKIINDPQVLHERDIDLTLQTATMPPADES